MTDAHHIEKIAEEIKRQRGDHIATDLVRAARHAGLPLSVACAVIEHETHFVNEFGHDQTIFAGAGRVTHAKYRLYKVRRGHTRMQGVGPAQLTYWAYQDEADRLGGCWKPYWNMLVAFRALAANIHEHGLVEGLHRYNGLAAPKSVYAIPVKQAADRWHEFLTGHRQHPTA